MNKQQLSNQVQVADQTQYAESMLKQRLAQLEEPSAYDFRMLASFYLNARRYEEACSVLAQMVQLAASDGNTDLLQSLYQDLGWAALLTGDLEQARRHFSCQRATLEELYEQSESRDIYRESDLNLFVATYCLEMWTPSRRHLSRLVQSFQGRDFGFQEFVIGRKESLNGDLPDFSRLKTVVFLESLEQAEREQPATSLTSIESYLN